MAEKKTKEVENDYASWNVYKKLQHARKLFLETGTTKSGKNMSMQFKYFELEDIVPAATRIFSEVGLLCVVDITNERALASIYNTDKSESPIEFYAPFDKIAPIISNSGKQVTNEMQALGSSITYIRRYLWQLVLDIIEADSIDNKPAAKDEAPAPKKPVSQLERAEIKQELTAAPENQASEESIAELKKLLKELMRLDPKQESFVQEAALKTEGFTKLAADKCAKMIEGVESMLANYKE